MWTEQLKDKESQLRLTTWTAPVRTSLVLVTFSSTKDRSKNFALILSLTFSCTETSAVTTGSRTVTPRTPTGPFSVWNLNQGRSTLFSELHSLSWLIIYSPRVPDRDLRPLDPFVFSQHPTWSIESRNHKTPFMIAQVIFWQFPLDNAGIGLI